MRDIEQKIRNINGSMAIEGMPLTAEDKARLRSLLSGEVSYEDTVRGIREKYVAKGVNR
jgi:ribosomal protein S6E (S10)